MPINIRLDGPGQFVILDASTEFNPNPEVSTMSHRDIAPDFEVAETELVCTHRPTPFTSCMWNATNGIYGDDHPPLCPTCGHELTEQEVPDYSDHYDECEARGY